MKQSGLNRRSCVLYLRDASLLLTGMRISWPSQATAGRQRAMAVDAFTNGIGINSHINWQDEGSAYRDTETVKRALTYLGVRYVRDTVPFPHWTLPVYQELASAGFRFLFPMSSTEFNRAGSFKPDLARVDALARSHPGSVAGIEGLNEINTWTVDHKGENTGTNLAVARDVQALLYHEKRQFPALMKVPVINLTFGGISLQRASVVGNLASYADFGAWHVYFGNGDQPRANILSGVASAKTLAPNRPVQITETNYYTATHAMEWGGGGVSEAVQAKFVLNLLCDAAKAGVERTYLYELLDADTDPDKARTVEGSLGLFRSAGTPKPSAAAIQNLLRILQDTSVDSGRFAAGFLEFSLTGLPSTGDALLLQKANGKFFLVVWAEPVIWNPRAHVEIEAPPATVVLTLKQPASSIRLFDPLQGPDPLAAVQNTSRIDFTLTDHPLIAEISMSGRQSQPARQ